MKALVVNALGRGFDLEDVDSAAPIGREVLVNVQASGLSHTDLLFATHDFVPMPSVLGHEVAGVVAAVGPDVTQVCVGDHVVGSLAQSCGACARCLSGRSFECTHPESTLRAFTVGNPADPKTAIGPMVSQKQNERVQSYIRKGIEEGAEVLAGGESQPEGLEAGYFVKPTVFVNVKNDMTIAQEEIFGSVLCVIAYDSEDEAIRIANDSKYGLHESVLRTDLQRARRVASQIQSGRVVINGMTDDPKAPWGGFKYSGVGREYGQYGIEAFLETRAILES
jgi:hypothetical protein